MSQIEIFYSYSHKDELLREELEKQLSLLRWQGVITNWTDRRIVAGQEWAGEISKHLDTAQIILLLISPDFLASPYCYSIEMKRAIERHERGEAQVIPIILRSVYWQGAPFGKLQALPKDAKPVKSWPDQDEAFFNIAEGIRKVVEDLAELQRILTNSAFEPTYVKPQLPATLAVPMSTPDGRGFYAETQGYNTHATKSREKQSTLTRRQLLIGSGAVGVLALGGVAWAITSNTNTRSRGQSTPVIGNTTATVSPSPGDPTLILLGHNKPVTSLGWSPKVNTLMSAGAEGNIFAWDIEALAPQKGQPLQPLAKQAFSAFDKIFVAWSPDGNAVAIANATGDFNANTSSIYVYQKDLRTSIQGYEKPILVPGVLSVDALGWTINKYIVTLDTPIDFINRSQFHLRLWDTTQPSLQLQPALLAGNLAVSFSSNPKLLSASPKKSTLVALGLSTGAIVGEVSVLGKAVRWQQRSDILPIMEHNVAQEINGIAWSANGTYVIGFYQDLAAKSIIDGWQWQQKNPTPLGVSVPDADTVLTTLATCTAPSSTLIAAGGKKGTVYIWDINKGSEPVQVLHGEKASNATVGALEWSADGKWLAAGYQDVNASILVWNVTTLNIS